MPLQSFAKLGRYRARGDGTKAIAEMTYQPEPRC